MQSPILELLKSFSNHIELRNTRALEVFTRTGEWHTKEYYPLIKELEAWEIDPNFCREAKANLPGAIVKCVDSITHIHNYTPQNSFDLIVLDNPQGCYGPSNKYCEHFDILVPSLRLLSNHSCLVLNANIQPYNYDAQITWQRRRDSFYKVEQANSLTTEFLFDFYSKLFQEHGFNLKKSSAVARNERIVYLGFFLERTN